MSSTRGKESCSTATTLSRLRTIRYPTHRVAQSTQPDSTIDPAATVKTVTFSIPPIIDDYTNTICDTHQSTPSLTEPHTERQSSHSTSCPALSAATNAPTPISALDESFLWVAHGYRIGTVNPDDLPFEQQPLSNLTKESGTAIESSSFHTTFEVYEKSPCGKKVLRYYKVNDDTSPLMSELEALSVAFFRLVAPKCFPKAVAHYNHQGAYVGVSSEAIMDFVSLKDNPLTDDDLNNEQIKSSLVVMLMLSYLFMEDDLHRGNLNKFGIRIDGDGLLWPILSQFKSGNAGDILRKPDKDTFTITAEDIRHFPDIRDASPSYWPTRDAPIFSESARNIIYKLGVPISKNAYSHKERETFKKLKDDKITIYEKFKTALMFTMIDGVEFRNTAKLHLRENVSFREKETGKYVNLTDYIVKFMVNRTIQLRETLLQMPEFQDFIKSGDGPRALREIKAAINDRNNSLEQEIKNIETLKKQPGAKVARLDKAIETYRQLIVPMRIIQEKYNAIVRSVYDHDHNTSTTQTRPYRA